MSDIVKSSILWWPCLVKGTLWMGIAFLSSLIPSVDKITNEALPTLTWLDYVKILGPCILAALVSVRTFLDQSVSRHAASTGNTAFFQKQTP